AAMSLMPVPTAAPRTTHRPSALQSPIRSSPTKRPPTARLIMAPSHRLIFAASREPTRATRTQVLGLSLPLISRRSASSRPSTSRGREAQENRRRHSTMRYTRWIALGIVALVATATGVGALTGTSPTRTSVNLMAVVDELGNVLFGARPGRVEVTNFPSSGGSEQVVTLLDAVALPPAEPTPTPIPGAFAVVPTRPFRNV